MPVLRLRAWTVTSSPTIIKETRRTSVSDSPSTWTPMAPEDERPAWRSRGARPTRGGREVVENVGVANRASLDLEAQAARRIRWERAVSGRERAPSPSKRETSGPSNERTSVPNRRTSAEVAARDRHRERGRGGARATRRGRCRTTVRSPWSASAAQTRPASAATVNGAAPAGSATAPRTIPASRDRPR